MTMDRINISELDGLIQIYFGQDYDIFDDSDEIEPKIDIYIASSHKGMKYALIADIDLFLEECDDLEKDFHERYQHDFEPALWGTTPAEFLQLVRDKVSQALRDEESR